MRCAHSIKSIFDIWMSEDTRGDTFLFWNIKNSLCKMIQFFCQFFRTLTVGWICRPRAKKKGFWNFASIVWKVGMQKPSFLAIWGTMIFLHEFVWGRMESYLQDKWGGKLKHDILKRKWKLIHFPIQAARIQNEIQ